MTIGGRVRVTKNTGILRPRWKATVEVDAYGVNKCRSKMFSNGYEAKKLMGTLAKERELEIFASKIIVDDVLLYGRIS